MERAQSASKENITEEEIPPSPPVNKSLSPLVTKSAMESPLVTRQALESPLVSKPVLETEEERAINYGPYREKYETLHSIGKGAFGFVKLALRREDIKEVYLTLSKLMHSFICLDMSLGWFIVHTL